MNTLFQRRLFSSLASFTRRTQTLSGINFVNKQRFETAAKASDGLAKTHHFLENTETKKFISPWHDLELEPSNKDADVTGVIEITMHTT